MPSNALERDTRAISARRQVEEHCASILQTKLSPKLFQLIKGKVPMQVLKELVNAVLDKESRKMLEYRDLLKHSKHRPDWNVSGANKFGRLAQGVDARIKGTDTIIFI